MHVLVLSELFPNPAWPALGIFVERQTYFLRPHVQSTVVAPIRILPHVRLWKKWYRPKELLISMRSWRGKIKSIPSISKLNGIKVYYPRYTSPPMRPFHGVWGYFAYAFLSSFLRKLSNEKRFDLIHVHTAIPLGTVAILAQKHLRLPIVLSVHGSDIHFTAQLNKLGAQEVRKVFQRVDSIIVHSNWSRDRVIEYGGDPAKINLIRLGAIPPKELLGKRENSTRDSVTILTVGYLIERKGIEYVIRAMRHLIDKGYKINYVIVGEGPEYEDLNMLVDQLNLRSVISFEGYKTHEDVWKYFNDCDIFILPSWDEAFGVVYLEALSLGKPAVGCFGEGGPEDLRSLGDCIELVKAKDVNSIVDTISYLYRHPERRKELGENGKEIVQKKFNWETNASAMNEVYCKALKAHKKD